MNLATLTAEGPDEALDSLRTALNLVPEATWKKGDPRRGGVHSSSGFSFTIADVGTPSGLVVAVRAFLSLCNERAVRFPRADISMDLSIGITVGDSAQFTASLEFTTADLLLLAGAGISLTVCAYPTSDEVNAAD